MPNKPLTEADALLADADVEDAARDYVEDGVGRFHFARHWARHRDPERVAAWLRRYGYDVDPTAVCRELERLAQDGPWRS